MKKIDCIAIDDEPLALTLISDYASRIPYLNLRQTFENPLEALDFLKNNAVDLIFLDIQMDELNGIQFLHVLKNKPMVVFTTAYDQYALEGYELDVADYLVKPFTFERMLKSVEKVCDQLMGRAPELIKNIPEPATNGDDFVFVKSEYHIERVNLCELLYIEGMGDYMMFHTRQKKIMSLQTFKKVEEALPNNRFIRVHKSFMVALDKIDKIENNRVYIGERIIPVGDSYRKPFYNVLDKQHLL